MGLFEMLLIAVVALLVVGPERMPEAVRTTMLTIGRAKRMMSTAFQDVERQVGADEIRKQLHNEDVMRSIEDAQKDLSNLDTKIENSISETLWTEDDQKDYEEDLRREEAEAAAAQNREAIPISIDEPEPAIAQASEDNNKQPPHASS